ncbi:hypothetical protein LTR56_010009 [Elasticomyces elasticus]|nr:hypothetical protein LTR56_010009 [Elasticomyces elasticus]KAK3665053.1 hypothetical protein LTR22_004109 [Elasticomyces elasticus]KAK4931572.1 hypothetical protein LTR49_001960 [Elasticomyces elasticus]KAK5766732.1 hypothetical protein LTS12_003081 [Elasticomyces elasticus]
MSSSAAAFDNAASLDVENSNLNQLTNEDLTAVQPMAATEKSMAQWAVVVAQREAFVAVHEAQMQKLGIEQDERNIRRDQREEIFKISKEGVDANFKASQMRVHKAELDLLSREFRSMEGERLRAKQKVIEMLREESEMEQEASEKEEHARNAYNFQRIFSKKAELSMADVEAMSNEGQLTMVMEHHLAAGDMTENERRRRSFYRVFSKKTGLSVADVEAMAKEGYLTMVVEHHLPALQESVESGEAGDESDLLLFGNGGMC